ncbi:ATP-binding protein [Microbacterium sp. CH12i]|uniref:ATP-binding protein n=1 Tax=Microbacterium sp. CH12i TaxID=1479651 RepID=UPI00056D790E|nr:ATP-binding protein [Microbacterium sp. CH12i]
MARAVPGRGERIEEFNERLSLMVDLQRLIGRIHVAFGERGIGKTSLLRAYQRLAEERDALCIWVTAGESGGLVAQIIDGIREATSSWPQEAAKSVRKHLDELTVTVGFPGVASVSAKSTQNPPVEAVGARALEKLIRTTTADRKRVKALILFIDEVQSADADGIRTLAYAWQHLQAEASDIPAAVYAAGLPNAPEQIADAVTFSERFAYRPLEMLTVGAQVAALREPAAELDVAWESEALELAAELAAGYPYAVQLYGDAAWVAAGRPDAGSTITARNVKTAQTSVDRDLRNLFAARWANTTPNQRRFLTAVAWLQEKSDSVDRADLAEVLDVSSRSLSSVRSRLIAKGLIRSEGHGRVTIPVPGFAGYIRELEDDPR